MLNDEARLRKDRKAPARARGLPTRCLGLLAAVSFVAGVLAPAASSSHAAVLPSCAIRLSDLRHGYITGGAGYSLTDLAALQYYVSLTPYNADAALVSYSSSFYYPGAPTARQGEDSISLYASAGRAHESFRQNVSSVGRWRRIWSYTDRTGHHNLVEQWHVVPGAPVGDESLTWQTETHDAVHAYSAVFLFFRRGFYLASVRLFGPRFTVSAAQIVPLGRLIDKRIQLSCALA